MPDRFARLLRHLLAADRESEWVELKENNSHPQKIAESISALANSATLEGQNFGYIVWGVEDADRQIVGTTFDPFRAKKGNENLENRLLRGLTPHVHLRFQAEYVNGRKVVILRFPAAAGNVVRFEGRAFIRSTSYTKPLEDFPDKERRLWALLPARSFEVTVAHAGATDRDVWGLLDIDTYARLSELPSRTPRSLVLERLTAARALQRSPEGGHDITNLGAILFARDLRSFSLERKSLRVIAYLGADRTATEREHELTDGYAASFPRALRIVLRRAPGTERISSGIRQLRSVYPEIAVRELLANALLHQDFASRGTGPMVEMFSDRMEITNAGSPLIPTDRFLDLPPRSRNERLGTLMRHLGMCEERGSGVDKVIAAIEDAQLPAPDFGTAPDHTRAVLFTPRSWAKMTQEERIRACYQHASLQWERREYLTNTSLRRRFALGKDKASVVSRLIRDAVGAGRIRPESGVRRAARYVPWYVRELEGGNFARRTDVVGAES